MLFNTTKKLNKHECGATTVEGCIIALGSNFAANKNLRQSRTELELLAINYAWSTEFVNPDYTATSARPKPDYTNQCGVLTLKQPKKLHTLIKICKQIEQNCQRVESVKGSDTQQQSAEPFTLVSIDIDILAVNIEGEWQFINERYPFKYHEMIGIKELIANNRLAI